MRGCRETLSPYLRRGMGVYLGTWLLIRVDVERLSVPLHTPSDEAAGNRNSDSNHVEEACRLHYPLGERQAQRRNVKRGEGKDRWVHRRWVGHLRTCCKKTGSVGYGLKNLEAAASRKAWVCIWVHDQYTGFDSMHSKSLSVPLHPLSDGAVNGNSIGR